MFPQKVLVQCLIWIVNPTFDELSLVDVLETLNFVLPGDADKNKSVVKGSGFAIF